MNFEKVPWEELHTQALWALSNVGGLLLVTQGKENPKPNVMTIGWVTFGIVWGKPIATVLVRPSRFTHSLLEENPLFTVNVPSRDLTKAVADCGKYSGRAVDKFASCGLTPVYLEAFPIPSIAECVASFQCIVVAKTFVKPESLVTTIQETYYGSGDYHTVYFGEIQASWKRIDVTLSS